MTSGGAAGRPDTLLRVLHIHRASRADSLADALAALLSETPANPFAPEVVAVPTRGMERWLTQRMSSVLGARAGRADGVCANVEFPSPHRLVTDAVAAASGIDPAEDPWLPERSVWPLLGVVEESLSEPWLATLAAYLGADTDPTHPADPMRDARHSRRLTTVRHLAGLFDRYSLHRPEMLTAWAQGEDHDAVGAPLPAASAWQAELWRRLRARIGVPDLAERTGRACERIADDPGLLDLPARLALFGLTRIPAGHLEIMRALAAGRDLHLFLLHPSRALWEKVTHGAPGEPVVRREADRTVALADNRLLASWGRDSREMQLVLTAGTPETSDTHHPSPPGALTRCSAASSAMSARTAVRPGHRCPGRRTRARCSSPMTGVSRSTPATGAHARSRWFATRSCTRSPRTTSLEPRDVIVMCPDIETFAPAHPGDLRRRRDSRTRAPSTCGSVSPTVRCARPTRCSASWPSSWSSPSSASPPLRSSTSPTAGRCAAAFASTTMTSLAWPIGSPRRASAGASTPHTARRTSSTRLTAAPGRPAWSGSCWG